MKPDKENLKLVRWFDFAWYSFSIIYVVVVTNFLKKLLTLYIPALAIFAIGYGLFKIIFLRTGKVTKLSQSGKIWNWFLCLVSLLVGFWFLFCLNIPLAYRISYSLVGIFFSLPYGLNAYKGERLALFHWVDQKLGKPIRNFVGMSGD